MTRAELNDKLQELFGDDEDIEIYFESFGEEVFTRNFKIIKDEDGDCVIQQ